MTERIGNPDALNALRDKAQADVAIRTGQADLRVTVHMGTCGIAAGARDVLKSLLEELGDAAGEKVTVRQTGCAGLCDQEPMMTLTGRAGETYRYGQLDRRKVGEIVRSHILGGKPLSEYLIKA